MSESKSRLVKEAVSGQEKRISYSELAELYAGLSAEVEGLRKRGKEHELFEERAKRQVEGMGRALEEANAIMMNRRVEWLMGVVRDSEKYSSEFVDYCRGSLEKMIVLSPEQEAENLGNVSRG